MSPISPNSPPIFPHISLLNSPPISKKSPYHSPYNSNISLPNSIISFALFLVLFSFYYVLIMI